MNDMRRLMEDGVPDPEPPRKLPSIMPWAIVAGVLVLISLGIRLFWPIPASTALPQCSGHPGTQQEACVKSGATPGRDAASPVH
ncbi:hypothetical protein [Asaia krungthepensis]|uniref:Uncharacterized protein n=1 Tax=Asaia krungthepensis NRIC 0535 TaxID=1307925 RepID=A0ABQ0PZL6_9PROT|nr:hypothetical protein [Asaia krungthepensis]GBQ85535.1 hypothetical protein AA0535_0788 [Asaia krungthepensis NRIC 0535]